MGTGGKAGSGNMLWEDGRGWVCVAHCLSPLPSLSPSSLSLPPSPSPSPYPPQIDQTYIYILTFFLSNFLLFYFALHCTGTFLGESHGVSRSVPPPATTAHHCISPFSCFLPLSPAPALLPYHYPQCVCHGVVVMGDATTSSPCFGASPLTLPH